MSCDRSPVNSHLLKEKKNEQKSLSLPLLHTRVFPPIHGGGGPFPAPAPHRRRLPLSRRPHPATATEQAPAPVPRSSVRVSSSSATTTAAVLVPGNGGDGRRQRQPGSRGLSSVKLGTPTHHRPLVQLLFVFRGRLEPRICIGFL